VSLLPAKINLTQLEKLRLVLAFAALLSPCASLTAASQQTIGCEISFPVAIQWNKQKGVKRYRLQIAADEKFQNVFFDGPVAGERYVASELSPGYYYWKVAPTNSHLGDFSRPAKFFVSGGVITTVELPNRATRARSFPAMVSSQVR
jgi:hypothetical protein